MTKFKLVWRVCPEPRGPYRAFHKRGWPMACFNVADGVPAASIVAVDGQEYKPCYAKMEDVGFDLKVRVAVPNSHGGWGWRTMSTAVRSIKAAKGLALTFYNAQPETVDTLLEMRFWKGLP